MGKSLVFVVALAACSAAEGLPPWPMTSVPGWSVVRVEATATQLYVLEEMPPDFNHIEPGVRRLRVIDRRTFAERTFAPEPTARISDFTVHRSGAASLAVVDDAGAISLVQLDTRLALVAAAPLEDAMAALDPPADPTMPKLVATPFTHASVRISAVDDDVVVAVFTSRNSVIAYRLRVDGGAFVPAWRTLVEPPVGLTPFLPIGGSFDTFRAITVWFRCPFATDEDGNSYFAVWAGQRRIPVHNMVFGDSLMRLVPGPGAGVSDSDVIVTRLDAAGRRQWSRVVGTEFEDEPYALAAAGGRVAVVGRSRTHPGLDNTQWNAWLAALDSGGGKLSSRGYALDASSIFLAVAFAPDGDILAGGSDAWSQNPDGLSITEDASKLLVRFADPGAEPARIALPAGPRNNAIESVFADDGGAFYAGYEDGAGTHSGDFDRTQIRATGVVGALR